MNNPFTGLPDFIVDVTAAGAVTGTTLATTGLVCMGSQFLSTDGGGNFICSTPAGGSAHNFLSATHTDTVSAGPTRGDLVVSNSTPTWARFGIGASPSVLTSNGTDPAWSASPTVTSLTANGTVTGATLDISGQEKFGRFTVANAYLNVGVGSVVTGTTILACPDVSGNHLNYNNATNVWSCGTTSSGGSNHNFLSSSHTDTVTASPTRGDIVVSNSTPAWARFAVGGTNTVLTANATDPAWSATPTVTSLTATNTVTGTVVDAATLENTGSVNAGVVFVRDSIQSNNTVTGPVADVATLENTGSVNSGNVLVRDSLSSNGTVTGVSAVDTPNLENSGVLSGGLVNVRDSLSANGTVSGTIVAATTVLIAPYGASPNIGEGGRVAQDTTDNQLLVGPSSVYPDKYQECHTYENLVAADDNMNVMNDRSGVTVTDASCYTTGSFTTQPILTFQNDAAGAIVGAPVCTGTSPPTWAVLGGANATLTAGQGLQFNTTNTPAPTFGTQTIICVAYRKTRK